MRPGLASHVEIRRVAKAFPGRDGTANVIVRDFDLTVEEGEFVSIIGHSGCGKSTVLSIIASLTTPTAGTVRVDGRPVARPGPDRAVVFQSPSLFEWMTAHENVALGVDAAFPALSRGARRAIVDEHLGRVGLEDDAHKKPAELSLGMRQRVGLARAFALNPRVLLLDEPFGMLDSITRMELQEVLVSILEKGSAGAGRKTAIMVTHDVDEAILLSDRIVMMTCGPAATVGGILEVPFERPRDRVALLSDPRHQHLRDRLIEFLEGQAHPVGPSPDAGSLQIAPISERDAREVDASAPSRAAGLARAS